MMKNQNADFTMTFRELSEIDVQNINNNGQNFQKDKQFWSLPKVMNDQEWPVWVQNYITRLDSKNLTLYNDRNRQIQMQGEFKSLLHTINQNKSNKFKLNDDRDRQF